MKPSIFQVGLSFSIVISHVHTRVETALLVAGGGIAFHATPRIMLPEYNAALAEHETQV